MAPVSAGGINMGGVLDPTRDLAPTGYAQFNQTTNVVASSSASVVLLPIQTASTFLLDRASGVTYTLPPPQVGLNFNFFVTVSVTSNNHIIQTDASTTFFLGSLYEAASASTGNTYLANGTSNKTVTMNGSTTGGLKGTYISAVCFSSTQWIIDGTVIGSGTLATPIS